ncbi:MAG: hypothetical protein ACI9O4_000715 [Chitinophagales bacterium]|jgi:hypothetical protein
MEILFKILNASIIPFWILLAFFVRSKLTQRLLFTHFIHLALSAFYLVFIVWGMLENAGGEGGMDSMEHLRIGFLNDKVLLAAWAHYLIFDLFVGTWIAKKCLEENISNSIKWPSLFLTLMFGPIGFLLFTVLSRYVAKK